MKSAQESNHEVSQDLNLVFESPVRSGPVFHPQGDGPRPRPVHQSPNTSKDRTGPLKTAFFRSWTGLDQSWVLISLNRFTTGFSTR